MSLSPPTESVTDPKFPRGGGANSPGGATENGNHQQEMKHKYIYGIEKSIIIYEDGGFYHNDFVRNRGMMACISSSISFIFSSGSCH